LHQGKNVDLSIEAFQELLRLNKNVSLLIVGKGVEEKNVEDAICFSDNDVYNEIIDILNIPRVTLSIEKFKPLLIKHQYDMITAFMICFNSHKTPQISLEDEWSYFFSDLLPNLNDGGAIYLSFNEEDDNEQSQNDLFNSFKKCTAIVNRNEISLNKQQIQKFVSGLC
jgi:hypothetical protein